MRVFFYCYPLGPPEKAGYESESVALAEGLKETGVETFSNINYWRQSLSDNDYLLYSDNNVSFNECDVVVFSSILFNYDKTSILPKDLFRKNRAYKVVFIDSSDELITPGFNDLLRNADIVLKTHYNSKYRYPSNFRPWQFGLTNRIINAVSPLPFEEREKKIMVNFRVKHKLRDMAAERVMPFLYQYLEPDNTTNDLSDQKMSELDLLFWHQTGRRHNPNFYNRLSGSVACSCFGGYLQKAISNNRNIFFKILRELDNRLNLFKYDRIYQYDSWRFWEAMVAGSCVIHIDFEKYGAVLPVMPVNGEHYLGVDFNSIGDFKNMIQGDEQIFQKVSANGRKWVLENYAPIEVAQRFTKILHE